jgi:opacity protein-like surface antigen
VAAGKAIGVRMKHHLLVLVSAAALAASHGVGAQMMGHGGGGGSMGDWEFRIGPVFQESKNVSFNGGSSADIDSTTGVKIGAGYYVTDQLIIGGNFSYGQSSFNGTVRGNTSSAPGAPSIEAVIENGHVDFSTMMFDATYTLLNGPIKPYGKVGLGWNWINTNIAAGPPQYGCWWDPWWGYICSGWQPTHGASSFAYQAGAGVQINFNRTFAINVDYQYTWIDLNNTKSTPGFGAVELLFVWRFPAYH